jgi:enoyl-CoA hydratase/carnithine racemase
MSTSASAINVKVHEPAGTIVLNRPDARNALTQSMLGDVRQALDDLYRERKVRAIILTGAGPAFCAGMDLNELHRAAQESDAHRHWGQEADAYRELLRTMLEITKPIIAAVNGPAVGGGAGLVLASDVVVAADTARFGLPEPRRGLVAGPIAPLLAFRIGSGHAARLLLTSSLIDAGEAVRIGVFHETIDEPRVWARAMEIAKDCAAAAPEAIQLTKRLITETLGEHLGPQLAAGAVASATSHTTESAREGIAAFIEKREPKW